MCWAGAALAGPDRSEGLQGVVDDPVGLAGHVAESLEGTAQQGAIGGQDPDPLVGLVTDRPLVARLDQRLQEPGSLRARIQHGPDIDGPVELVQGVGAGFQVCERGPGSGVVQHDGCMPGLPVDPPAGQCSVIGGDHDQVDVGQLVFCGPLGQSLLVATDPDHEQPRPALQPNLPAALTIGQRADHPRGLAVQLLHEGDHIDEVSFQ